MQPLLFLLPIVFLLSACQGTLWTAPVPSDAVYALQGGEVVLHVALPVTAGKARVFLQAGGRPEGRNRYLSGGFDQYRPHCAFGITSVDHQGVEIAPDRFRITAVQQSLQPVVGRAPIRVAALGPLAMFDGLGSSAYHMGYHLWLDSERQPGVRRLSCYGVYAEPGILDPPTLAEMRAALGEVADIEGP